MSSAIGEQSPCLELLCDIPFTLKVTRQGDSDRKDKDTSDENTVLPQNSLGFLKKLKDAGRWVSQLGCCTTILKFSEIFSFCY